MSGKLIGRTLLNQFRVDAFIASGGAGSVFQVWDFQRQVPLAMKVLHAEYVEEPAVFKQFQREAHALENLAHPNIVPFYGLYQDEDVVFMLERYIDGPSLKDLVVQRHGRPYPVEEALPFVRALCAALGYAHARGVIHCDVKPGNVMIDPGGIYLTDFGIARHADSTVTTFAGGGTPAYMAPEQIQGKIVTPATDIYALGVTLFEMLTGQRLFHGFEISEEEAGPTPANRLRLAHLRLAPPDPRRLNPAIPPALAGVLLKALEKEPQERFPDTQTFFQTFCQAANIPVSAAPNAGLFAGDMTIPAGATLPAGATQSAVAMQHPAVTLPAIAARDPANSQSPAGDDWTRAAKPDTLPLGPVGEYPAATVAAPNLTLQAPQPAAPTGNKFVRMGVLAGSFTAIIAVAVLFTLLSGLLPMFMGPTPTVTEAALASMAATQAEGLPPTQAPATETLAPTSTSQPTPSLPPTATASLQPTATETVGPAPIPVSIRRPPDNNSSRFFNLWDYLKPEYKPQMAPGEVSYEGVIPSLNTMVLDWHWCAKDKMTLADNLDALSLNFRINGEIISEDLLRSVDYHSTPEAGGTWECTKWFTLLDDWPPGSKVEIEVTHEWSTSIDDGFDTFPAGKYTRIYWIRVE